MSKKQKYWLSSPSLWNPLLSAFQLLCSPSVERAHVFKEDRDNEDDPEELEFDIGQHMSHSLMADKSSKIHSKNMILKGLNECREERDFCDVILIVGEEEKEIHAHKVVLSGFCSFFRGMFRKGRKESTADRVTLREWPWSANVMEALTNYAYSGAIHLNPENISKILQLSNYIEASQVFKLGLDYVVDNLDGKNCVPLWMMCDKHLQNPESLNRILDWMKSNGEQVLRNQRDLYKLGCNIVIKLIKEWTGPEQEGENSKKNKKKRKKEKVKKKRKDAVQEEDHEEKGNKKKTDIEDLIKIIADPNCIIIEDSECNEQQLFDLLKNLIENDSKIENQEELLFKALQAVRAPQMGRSYLDKTIELFVDNQEALDYIKLAKDVASHGVSLEQDVTSGLIPRYKENALFVVNFYQPKVFVHGKIASSVMYVGGYKFVFCIGMETTSITHFVYVNLNQSQRNHEVRNTFFTNLYPLAEDDPDFKTNLEIEAGYRIAYKLADSTIEINNSYYKAADLIYSKYQRRQWQLSLEEAEVLSKYNEREDCCSFVADFKIKEKYLV